MRATTLLSSLFGRTLALLALTVLTAGAGWTMGKDPDAVIERISPKDAHRMAASGQALLVCSYDDDHCRSVLLEGALLRSEFEARVPALTLDQTVIFY